MAHEHLLSERAMELETAIRHGHRIRHCDWPPYHFAELRRTRTGDQALLRISPQGDLEPLELRQIKEQPGWSVIAVGEH